MKRSRVSSIIDMSRLSAAVSRPGIDPRIWCSLAFALGESHLDEKHGDFVDVQILPSELEVTVRVPQSYAGNAFGVNEGRIHKDDELIVLFPDGDPAVGGVVVARLWSQSDPPAKDAIDNPKDCSRTLEKDLSERLRLSGTGQWIANGEDEFHHTTTKTATYEAETFVAKTGKVRLGSSGASEQLVKGNTYQSAEQQFLTQLTAAFSAMTPAGAMMASAGAIMVIPIVGAIIAGPMVAAAGAAITTACGTALAGIAAFTGPYSTYLSTVSKTD